MNRTCFFGAWKKEDLELAKIASFLVVLLIALFVVFTFFLGTTHFWVTVTSDSMQPGLYRGDVIILMKTNEYHPGDVIAFSRGSGVIVHRVIEKTPMGFRTQGDHNSIPDMGVVLESSILGKQALKIPFVGFLNLWISGR